MGSLMGIPDAGILETIQGVGMVIQLKPDPRTFVHLDLPSVRINLRGLISDVHMFDE